MSFDIRHETGDENDIERAVADYLVGDVHIAAFDVAGFRRAVIWVTFCLNPPPAQTRMQK